MTESMLRLADMAERTAPPGAVETGDVGFTLDAPGAPLEFFAPGGDSGVAYCRTRIAALPGRECPGALAEAALKGNFFWRGTDGAVLSLEEDGVYMTDRLDDTAFAGADEFAAYAGDFAQTAAAWRVRLGTFLSGKEAAQ